MNEYICYCDAGVSPSLGITLGCYIINITTSESIELSEMIKCAENNNDANFAEGCSIKMALNKFIELNAQYDKITIYTDSLNVVSIINNYNNIRNKKIRLIRRNQLPTYILDILTLFDKFKSIKLKWISRDKNKEAHFLCRTQSLKANNINVTYIADGIYLAQSSKDLNKFYTVDLNNSVCNCRFYTFQKHNERKKCKHIIAAEQLSLTLSASTNSE